MKKQIKNSLLFVLVFASLSIYSQDKVDSTALFYTYAQEEDILVNDSIRYSKKMDGFYRYRPELEYGDFFQRQSNIGHALRKLDVTHNELIFDLDRDIAFSDPYFPYLWRKRNIKYYTSLKPITDLYYVMGKDKEQYFKVLHAQPITPEFYFSVEYKVLNSPGTYQHHLANHESPVFNLRYSSNSNKYHASATYFHNKVQADDHGGIQALSYFKDSTDYNERQLIPVNLPNARLLIKGGGLHFNQMYHPSADSTSAKDSLGIGFYHDLYYLKDTYTYTDGGDINNFYPAQLNIQEVKDSTAIKKLVNTFGARFSFNTIDFDTRIKHKYYEAWQQKKDTFVHIWNPAIGVTFENGKNRIKLYGDMAFSGSGNNQEWKLRANISRKFNQFAAHLKGGYVNAFPSVLHSWYHSTYYSWDKHFDNTDLVYLAAEAEHPNIMGSVSFSNITDYIYFSNAGEPEQNDESFQLLQFNLEPKIEWNDITFKNILKYQKVFGDDYLRLPEFMSKHELYYSFNLIQDVLKTQIGTQLTFHSSFTGHKYIPATQAFVLQNDQQLGNYPYLDVFANFKIKRARIFVRYSHLNALLGNKRYFLMPSYPMRDDSFQFGISWMFYD
ncbi:MAG: putative porin [Bacteroidales bacterium]|nr:putative porin [Bacteroidales bacterium]MCF8327073.1 putative porin [Bacteroidales bacterium]